MNLASSHMIWNHVLAPEDSPDVLRGSKVFFFLLSERVGEMSLVDQIQHSP